MTKEKLDALIDWELKNRASPEEYARNEEERIRKEHEKEEKWARMREARENEELSFITSTLSIYSGLLKSIIFYMIDSN